MTGDEFERYLALEKQRKTFQDGIKDPGHLAQIAEHTKSLAEVEQLPPHIDWSEQPVLTAVKN